MTTQNLTLKQAEIGTSGEYQKQKFIDSVIDAEQGKIERIIAFEPVYRLTQSNFFEILPNKTAISTSDMDNKLLAADIVSSKFLFFPNNIFSTIAANMYGSLKCDLFTQHFRGSITLDNCMIKIANAHNGTGSIRISPTICIDKTYVPVFLPTSHIHLGNVDVTKHIIDETMKVTKSLASSSKHIEAALRIPFNENSDKLSNSIVSKIPDYMQIEFYNYLNNTSIDKDNFTLIKNTNFPNSPINLTGFTPIQVLKFFIEEAPRIYQQKRNFALIQQNACEKITSSIMNLTHVQAAFAQTLQEIGVSQNFQEEARRLAYAEVDKQERQSKKKNLLNI